MFSFSFFFGNSGPSINWCLQFLFCLSKKMDEIKIGPMSVKLLDNKRKNESEEARRLFLSFRWCEELSKQIIILWSLSFQKTQFYLFVFSFQHTGPEFGKWLQPWYYKLLFLTNCLWWVRQLQLFGFSWLLFAFLHFLTSPLSHFQHDNGSSVESTFKKHSTYK